MYIIYHYISFTSPVTDFFRWNRIFPKFHRAADFELQMWQLQISVPRSHNNRLPYNDKLMQIMSFLWTYGSNDHKWSMFSIFILVCQQSSKHKTLMNFLPHALCLTWCLNYSTPHVEKSDPNSLRADWLGKHLGGQLQMQPNVPSFSRVVSSVGIGRTSTFDTNAWLRRTLKQLLITFFSAFPYFCPHPKTGANFNNPKAPAVAAMRLSSRPVSAAAMALSPLGCAAWTFPGAIGSFQRTILQQSHVATISTPHLHLPYLHMWKCCQEVLPSGWNAWWFSFAGRIMFFVPQHFAFLKSKPTFPNHNGI